MPSVLVVTDFFPHAAQPHEGIFVRDQLAHLAGANIAAVITPSIWYPPLAHYRRLRTLSPPSGWHNDEGLLLLRPRLHYVPNIAERFIADEFYRKSLAALRECKIAFDLIHAYWAYRSGYVGALLAQRFRKPLIVNVNGSDVEHWLHQPSKRAKSLQALHAANAIIALSISLQNGLIAEGISPEKIAVIPQCIDLQRFSPRPSTHATAVRNRFGNAFVFACVGNHYHVKGIDILLRALAKTQANTGVILIGDGPERPALERMSGALDLDKRVWFVGMQSHSEIPDWLNAVDALVLSSRSEGLPTVVLEALACGKPIVGTRVGGVAEAVDDDCGIVVPSEDPDALARGLNEAPRRNWDAGIIRQHGENYSWKNFEARIKKVYDRALPTKMIEFPADR